MTHEAMAISSGRNAVRRRSRGSDPRDRLDERRKTYTLDSIRRNDGSTGFPPPRPQGRREKVMRYLKTHQPLCIYVIFVGLVEVMVLLVQR